MLTTFVQFFQEDNGRGSNTRFNSTMMICCGCAILVGTAFKANGTALDANVIAAAGLLLATGAGQKLIQKGMEQKVQDPQG